MAECNLRGFLCGLEALTALRAPETLATTVRPACHMKFTDARGPAKQHGSNSLPLLSGLAAAGLRGRRCSPCYAEEISLLAPFAEIPRRPGILLPPPRASSGKSARGERAGALGRRSHSFADHIGSP